MSQSNSKSIHVPVLARVEGEGALDITISENSIQFLQLKIFEPPRLFEKFLEGRSHTDVLDIVARICGICPVAYQMSAVHAIEQCFAIQPSPWIRTMRRLFYCGEWLESHSLHVHLLALPDYLGFHSAPEMAKVYPNEVRRGMRLQAFGNELIRLLGGRSVHPVGACTGGFYKAPSMQKIQELLSMIPDRIEDCKALIRWLSTLSLGDNSHDFTCVSLQHPDEYPMNEGQIVSDQGLAIGRELFEDYFKEFQVPYSTALHCLLKGQPYLVGPLARLNLNIHHMPEEILALLQELRIQFPSRNMFHSIIARAVEMYYCILEAQKIMQQYQKPDKPNVSFTPQAGVGYGCTEAPRGLLWHRYEFDEQGIVKSACIVPPTSQNQARIEADIKISLQQYGLSRDVDSLRRYSEMIIRNYDPCISCSTHFLTLNVNRL